MGQQRHFDMKATVHRYKKARFRFWLAIKLARLAARVYDFTDDGNKYEIECGWLCSHTVPYGFVPECGCPVHDPEEYEPVKPLSYE